MSYFQHSRLAAAGFQANVGRLRPFGDTTSLPHYLRYYLGDEWQIRGVDIRTVGPTDADSRGDRREQYIDLTGRLRTPLLPEP